MMGRQEPRPAKPPHPPRSSAPSPRGEGKSFNKSSLLLEGAGCQWQPLSECLEAPTEAAAETRGTACGG